MSVSDCFSATYADARERFVATCRERGVEPVPYRHPLCGPDGAPLFLDAARFGPDDASRVVFVSSGTHGVEGFCGSGIQVALLREGIADRLPEDVALVLIHAVNPYGFAWLRRVNEDNVDINRNFLDHGAGGYPDNPLYEEIFDALNPTAYAEADVQRCLAEILDFTKRVGSTASYQALSGGQYRHPTGMQYGGQAPVWSNRTLRRVWDEHLAEARLAVQIDLHSGLGPEGVGLVLQTAAAESAGGKLAAEWYPDVIRSEPAQGEQAALVSGLLGVGLCESYPLHDVVAIVLEFGTREQQTVILATHADNWLHAHGDPSSKEGRRIKERIRDAFYIDADDWKEKVVERARQILAQTFEGVQRAPGKS
ncbi:MAG: M14 family metallopeptidase [Proteobacteria bacterium]|nr:M14 family metallopeptidase [Pseudomonadota bacterium]